MCDDCERETPHEVHIEKRAENPESEMASASRQPYRVTECQNCGNETERRMDQT